MPNSDKEELAKFDGLAHHWWDPMSELQPLHEINPLRLKWIETHISLADKRVLDVGCGGGILAESMASKGAHVTGIDLSEKALAVARLHLLESNLTVNYQFSEIETYATAHPGTFDAVTCMEMLEHVPDPRSVIEACSTLLKPGCDLFISTINRNIKAYAFAIIGAEYILNMLSRGTHEYSKFIKPSELSGFVRDAGMEIIELVGLAYNPITKKYRLDTNTAVNYLMHARKP